MSPGWVEIFRLTTSTPSHSVVHGGAFLEGSAHANWLTHRGIDLSAGFDLKGQVEAAAGSSALGASFVAGAEASGGLTVRAGLPLDLFTAAGLAVMAQLEAALTGYAGAKLTLGRQDFETQVLAQLSSPFKELLSIVMEETDISAGLWAHAGLAIDAVGQAVLSGTLLPDAAGNPPGFTLQIGYHAGMVFGAGMHGQANLALPQPRRMVDRLADQTSQLLLDVLPATTQLTGPTADEVAQAIGAARLLIPLGMRAMFDLGVSLLGPPNGHAGAAVESVTESLLRQGRDILLRAAASIAGKLLAQIFGDTSLTDALQNLGDAQKPILDDFIALIDKLSDLDDCSPSDIAVWLAALLACLPPLVDLLARPEMPAPLRISGTRAGALLWCSGVLLGRIIAVIDTPSSAGMFGSDQVSPPPPPAIAGIVRPDGRPVTFADAVSYVLSFTELEQQLSNAPGVGSAVDWLRKLLGVGPSASLLGTLLADLVSPTPAQRQQILQSFISVASDAVNNNVIPHLLEPLRAAYADDPVVSALIDDVARPTLVALPAVILPALPGLGTDIAGMRLRETASSVLVGAVTHPLLAMLETLVHHMSLNGAAALHDTAAVIRAGSSDPVIQFLSDLGGLLPIGPDDIAGMIDLCATVLTDLSDNNLAPLLNLVDVLMRLGFGTDPTAVLHRIVSSDAATDPDALGKSLEQVAGGAVRTIGDVLSGVLLLVASHAENSVLRVGVVLAEASRLIIVGVKAWIEDLKQAWAALPGLIDSLEAQLQALLNGIANDLHTFAGTLRSKEAAAVSQLRAYGANIVTDAVSQWPPWARDIVLQLYYELFDALAFLPDLLTGLLASAADGLADLFAAAAGSGRITGAEVDNRVRQHLADASATHLHFDLRVTVGGAILFDLGRITISASAIAAILGDLMIGDSDYQTMVAATVGQVQHAGTVSAQLATAKQAAANQVNPDQVSSLAAQMVPAPIRDHLYTTNAAERDHAVASLGYVADGSAGWLLAAEAPGTVPLYRLFNQSHGDHLYTSDPAERDRAVAQAGYVLEGTTGYLLAVQQPSTVPLYRLYKPDNGYHFYTIDVGERDKASQSFGYQIETTPGYVYTTQQANTSQLWRLRQQTGAPLEISISSPSPNAGSPFGSSFIIELSGVNDTFTQTTLGVPPRISIELNDQPWYYRPEDWLGNGAGQLSLSAVILARPVPSVTPEAPIDPPDGGTAATSGGPGPTSAASTTEISPPSAVDTGLVAVVDLSADHLLVTDPTGKESPVIDQLDYTLIPLAHRFLLEQMLFGKEPSAGIRQAAVIWSDASTARTVLQGQGNTAVDGPQAPLPPLPRPPIAAPPPPAVALPAGRSRSTPQLFGRIGLNTLAVTVADGDGQLVTSSVSFLLTTGAAEHAISAAHSGSVLDVAGGPEAVHPGDPIDQWEWLSGSNQRWQLDRNPDGTSTFVAENSGLALDVGAGSGQPTQQAIAGTASQALELRPQGNGYIRLRHPSSGLSLGVASASMSDGAPIELQPWLQAQSQQWLLVPAPPFDPAAVYTVVASNSGLALDVDLSTVAAWGDGGIVQQWTSLGGANQRWRFVPIADSQYLIIAEHSGRCLDLTSASTANGVPIQVWQPHGGPTQCWRVEPSAPGLYRIVNVSSGSVLDVTGGPAATQPGDRLQQWQWLSGSNQQWHIAPANQPDPTAPYAIIAKHSGLALDVPSLSLQSGTVLQQWAWNNGPNQHFLLQPNPDGTVTVTAEHSGLCLEVTGGGQANGVAVQQATPTGSSAQSWQIQPAEPGMVRLTSAVSGKVLDVTGGPTAVQPGSQLQQWDWLGNDNQKWYLTR